MAGMPRMSASRVTSENGFVFRHDRPEELALILRRLFEDEELVRRVRQGARATPILTASRHAEIIRGLYREAIDRVVQGDPPSAGDREELDFLHTSLLAADFGSRSIQVVS
jgi:hypothetical protein